jgi:hypothetical protein
MFVAGANGCPFSNPGPIEAYMTAASHFHSTFGRPYQRVDGRAGELTEACQLLVTHKAFLDECRGDVEKEHRLLGQKEFLLTFVNPFPAHDPERALLDATGMSNVCYLMLFPLTQDPFSPTAGGGVQARCALVPDFQQT